MDRVEHRLRYYDEILSVFDPDEVLRDLNVKNAEDDILLLCSKKSGRTTTGDW